MTYFQFHLLFNLPVLLGLILLNWKYPASSAEMLSLGTVLAAVMIFTSPWDNWAVKRGIWDFPPSRVWRRIGWLPVEEYLFFVLQTVHVILSVRWILLTFPSFRTGLATPLGPAQGSVLLVFLLIWGTLGWRSGWRPRERNQGYAWHLLFWFLPVILLQWILAADLFLHSVGLLLIISGLWGTYYVLADLFAVHRGVWFFDENQIIGWKLRGVLPWEEIAFFYLTSLLVAQSYLLLLPASLR